MRKFRIFLLLCVLALTIGMMAVACRKNPDNPTPGEQVKLTLVANDGSEATIEEIEKNQSYTLPTPTRSGYAFSGWYLKEDFSGDAVTEVKPDADLSVYAKWEKLYTLTLDPSGGTLSTTNAMFVFLLIVIVLLVGALSFFPALALGPIAEFFSSIA